MAEFEVRDVSAWEAVNPEPIGRDAKLWVREPGAPSRSRERDWLLKPVIVTASGHRQGEDWTEKIVSELGGLLGVPCAEIKLAVRRGVPGSISRNVAPDGWNLVLGSVLLSTGNSLRRASSVDGFLPFLSFPEWQRAYTSQHLFPLFSQRIMSPRRPDFSQFLHQLHLNENATPWEQLARSEGRRTGDTVQVFPIPTVHADGSTSCRFLVHGIRHVAGGQLPPSLTPGDELELQDDPANPVNPEAVLVCSRGGDRLGYVPDLLLEHLRVLRDTGSVCLTVEHVNGPEVPAHLRLLVLLDGHAPADYQPMSGPRWQTY